MNLVDPTAAQFLLLVNGQCCWVDSNATFSATQGDVGDGGFPGHPHRQGAHSVHSLRRVKTDASFSGATSVIVLYTKSKEHPDRAIVHTHRNLKFEFPSRPAQHFSDLGVQSELSGYMIELALCHRESVDHLFCHLDVLLFSLYDIYSWYLHLKLRYLLNAGLNIDGHLGIVPAWFLTKRY